MPGVKQDSVYKWIVRKDMPAHKVGRLWKCKKDEVDGRAESGGAAPRQPKPRVPASPEART